MPDSHRSSALESVWGLLWVGIGVIGIGALLWLGMTALYPTLDKQALFGTALGGINTFFGALAFAALTVTLLLQRRALELQRLQMASQQLELVEQNGRLARQEFEGMLFRLLGLHHEIARDVKFRDIHYGKDLSGREAFRQLADDLCGLVSTSSRRPGEHSSIETAQDGYKNFHNYSRGTLDHYFRNLYHVVKFIDASGIAEPRRYTSLVRAQLSPAELILLFYNGLTSYGEKFKPLIEKYALLEQLPHSELPLAGHKSLYSSTAYA